MNAGTSLSTLQRAHSFSRCFSGGWTRRKLSRTARGESSPRSFDVRGPGLKLFDAMDLPVHPFQGGGEYLLALQGMFGRTGKVLSFRRSFATRLTPLSVRQCAFFVAHITQALPQSLEVIKSAVVNFRMMAAQDDAVLVMVKDAALELAGYGHGSPSWVRRTSRCPN